MGDLASLMQEPIIDEAHVEEDLCLLIGLLAAHNEPETSDQTARDLATHSQSEGREHPSPANPALAAGASCADAAWAAGFSDQAHLTRAFKERLGMTPGFYQRAIAGADPADALASSPEQVRP